MKGIVADLAVGTHGENGLPGCPKGSTNKVAVFGTRGIASAGVVLAGTDLGGSSSAFATVRRPGRGDNGPVYRYVDASRIRSSRQPAQFGASWFAGSWYSTRLWTKGSGSLPS